MTERVDLAVRRVNDYDADPADGESATGGVDRDRSGVADPGLDLAEEFSVWVVGAQNPVVVDDEQTSLARRVHRCDIRDRDAEERFEAFGHEVDQLRRAGAVVFDRDVPVAVEVAHAVDPASVEFDPLDHLVVFPTGDDIARAHRPDPGRVRIDPIDLELVTIGSEQFDGRAFLSGEVDHLGLSCGEPVEPGDAGEPAVDRRASEFDDLVGLVDQGASVQIDQLDLSVCAHRPHQPVSAHERLSGVAEFDRRADRPGLAVEDLDLARGDGDD